MKFSLRSGFVRLCMLATVSISCLTLTGWAAGTRGALPACAGWPLCVPTNPAGWYPLLHVVFGAISGGLLLGMALMAWTTYRQHLVILPLTTITGVLYFGQAFVGAMQVPLGYPLHLRVLHVASAVSLWIALLALLAISAGEIATSSVELADPPKRRLSDFLMLGKPWIVALLLLTTFGGLVAGGKAWPSLGLAVWTLVGGAMAAMGSSALNQFIDRDLDSRMQRTARRPLPSGRLTPAEGLSFGLALCLASYYLLASMVNFTAALLSLAGIFYYVIFYSILLKRATAQNIVIGGGAGAIPPMVGWAAATGHLSIGAWILFLIIFMWTPPHFWALAIVRSKDYERAGVPMLPVVAGERATRDQILLYSVLLVGTTLLMPLFGAAGKIYLAVAISLGALLLVAAVRVWRIPGNKVAWTMYRWSSVYLMLIFFALVVDAVV